MGKIIGTAVAFLFCAQVFAGPGTHVQFGWKQTIHAVSPGENQFLNGDNGVPSQTVNGFTDSTGSITIIYMCGFTGTYTWTNFNGPGSAQQYVPRESRCSPSPQATPVLPDLYLNP